MAGMGHNSMVSFDAVVAENLTRGLLLTQRDVLLAAIDDPRLSDRHLRVLAKIILRTNKTTGLAFPGWQQLMSDTQHLAGTNEHSEQPFHDEASGYTEGGLTKTLSELMKFGYLVSKRKKPEGGNRVLAHYTIVKPSIEQLQEQIAAALEVIRNGKKKGPPPIQAKFNFDNPTPAGNLTASRKVSSGGKVTSTANPTPVDPANPTPVDPANPTPVDPTVTSSKKEPEDKKDRVPISGEPAAKPSASADLPTCPDEWVEFEFEQFWQAFPPGRRVDKGGALDTYRKIVTGRHKSRRATPQMLLEGARRYAASKPNPEYTPMPTTWLNGGRWLDDLEGSSALRTQPAQRGGRVSGSSVLDSLLD